MENIYQRQVPQVLDIPQGEAGPSLAFRKLDLESDLPVLHNWVSHPQAARFWQLNGYDREKLHNLYSDLLLKPGYHSLIGLYGGKPVCQVDVYRIRTGELSSFLPQAGDNDCGLHFLMAPPRESFKGLSLLMLRSFMDMYFSFPFAGDLYAEPDELNALANRLAVKAGFRLFKKASLQDKIANVYKITKQQYLAGTTLMTSFPETGL